MNLTDSIKNKYNSVKESLKASIFSKNKSIIRISEFSKKSTFSKILTFTAVNMFVVIPYFIWFASLGNLSPWVTTIIPTFFFGFLITNSLFFAASKSIYFLISLFKRKEHKEVPLIINWNDNSNDSVKAEYYPKGFMNRIREFFIASGSVATSFLPFLVVMNIVLYLHSLSQSVIFNLDFAMFSTFINYLRIDSVLLVLFTTLTVGSIYSVRALSFLRKVLFRAISAQKGQSSVSFETNSDSYKPQRALPVEEFIPSLSKEFRKEHNIQVFEETKTPLELKKD